MFDPQASSRVPKRSPLASFMFASRWLQLPSYLGLIDVVMISNLLIMGIVGGYETFVARMYRQRFEALIHNTPALPIT
jgi:uncharacterized membrane protein YqhA